MSENFDYNEVFMGVVAKKRDSYLVTFEEDYRLKRLTEAVKLKTGRILDIGCGGGLLTESLPYYYPQLKVYGYDVSKIAIKYAQKFGSGKVTYKPMSGKKIPYQNNFFDVCICLDVMEHIPDLDFFLKEVKRVLKKNGKFFLVVPCEGQQLTFTWLFQKIKFGNRLTYKNYGHIHPEFTHKSVVDLLKNHGFKIEKKTYSEHWLYQVTNYFAYFLPKEIMELVLGKKAEQYYDRGVIAREVKGASKGVFDYIRQIWFKLGGFANQMAIKYEIENLKSSSTTAWKIHLLSSKD